MITTGREISKCEITAALQRNFIVLLSDAVFEELLGHKFVHKTYSYGMRYGLGEDHTDLLKEEATSNLLKIIYKCSDLNSIVILRASPEFYYDPNTELSIFRMRLSTNNKKLEDALECIVKEEGRAITGSLP